tara:strand:+ start:28 stop:195 length:168 start_codon:yes stop_codon:yes gene_type:complete
MKDFLFLDLLTLRGLEGQLLSIKCAENATKQTSDDEKSMKDHFKYKKISMIFTTK